MNQPKPSSSTMPLGSNPQGQAGPSGTIVNPAAQQAPHAPEQAYAQAQAQAPAYAPAPAPGAPVSGGYSPYPGVAMPAGYPPTNAQQPQAMQQMPLQQPMAQPQPLPPAPASFVPATTAQASDRVDELAGGARTMYEFSGTAAGAEAGDKRTFIGGLDSMPDMGATDRSERSSNLKGGASSWILIIVGIAVVGGGLTFLTMNKSGSSEGTEVTAGVASAEGDNASAPDIATVTPEDAAAKKAEEDAAAQKAEEDAAAKVDADAAAKVEADAAAKAKAKKKTPAKKKSVTKKKKKRQTTRPKDPESKKPTRLTPKKPPRDDGFGGLPKPP